MLEALGSLVRWFVLRPGDSALQWFDEERALEMLRSNVATEMFSHLEVKEANAPCRTCLLSRRRTESR